MMIRHRILLPLFATVVLAFSACTEVGPLITFTDTTFKPDTTYVDMNLPTNVVKRVLIEEFTGVDCNNCPQGSETLKDVLAAHPDSVIALAIHNDNPLAKPFPGYEDFRTTEGIQISQKLGGSGAIPTAAIDRKFWPGPNRIAMIRSQWENSAKIQMQETPLVAIDLATDFNAATREVVVEVKMHFLVNVDSTVHLSLFIKEDSIVNPQKLQDLSVNYNYVHYHILRGMLTPVFGIQVHDTTEAGRVVIKYFKYTVPPGWREDHLKVVAAVHRIGSTDLVLQAREAKVK